MKLKLLLSSLSILSFFVGYGQIPTFSFDDTSLGFSDLSSKACVVDMNGDFLDDVVRVQNNLIRIDYQLASGGFNPEIYSISNDFNSGWSIAAADIDGNGYNDLLLADYGGVSFIFSNGFGQGFTVSNHHEFIFSQRSTFSDIDNDGLLDAFVCHDIDQNHPYRNMGNGVLQLDQSLLPTADRPGNYAAIWVDYDNDGDSDLYITKCKLGSVSGDIDRTNLMYRNEGNGNYTEVGFLIGMDDNAQSWATSFEDFDNDGDFDAFIVNHDHENRFMRNNGDGTFTDIIFWTGIFSNDLGSWENCTADFNNDGYIDIYSDLQRELYINNGNMTFTGIDFPVSRGAIGDLNNDGFLDIYNNGEIYFNNGNTNNWIKINTEGTISNRSGIGARVEIYGSFGRQIREVRSGEGFAPMHSLTTHFGIGQATELDSLVIKWPSGLRNVVYNPEINSTHNLVEVCTLNVANLEVDGNTVICEDQSTNLIAPEGYTYLWNTSETTNTLEISEPGEYSVTISDTNGCEVVKSQIITSAPSPTASIEVNASSICAGETAQLTAIGGINYQWSNSANTSTINIDEAGTYTVTVTNADGCTATAQQQVTVNPIPNAEITVANNQTVFCEGASTDLVASGGVEYQWNTDESNPSIQVSDSGNYSVTVIGENGCSSVASQSISVYENPTVQVNILTGNAAVCVGEIVELAAIGQGEFNWNTNQNTETIDVTSTGNYAVTLTDENGCTAFDEQYITFNDLPFANIEVVGGTAQICPNETAQLVASGGNSYSWSTSEELPDITVNQAGNYSVTVTDINGCQSSTSQQITALSEPNLTIQSSTDDFVICSNLDDIELTAMGAETYEWNTDETTATITADISGIYSVTGTDENGCQSTIQQEVIILEVPEPNLEWQGTPHIVCEGETNVVTVTDGVSYLWSTGEETASVPIMEAGQYIVTITYENECNTYLYFNVEMQASPEAIITYSTETDVICTGDTSILTATGGGLYLWNTGDVTNEIEVSTTAEYAVTVINEHGCTDFASQTITVNPSPELTITSSDENDEICQGDSLIFTANGATSYVWSNADTGDNITVMESGNYQVTATDDNNCTAVANQSVVVHPIPTATITISEGNATFCEGDTAILQASGGTSFLWSNNATSSEINVTEAGTYQVSVTDQNGCMDTYEQIISVHPKPVAVVDISTGTNTLCADESAILTASGGTDYNWSTGESTSAIEINATGVYTVIVSDENDCQDQTEVYIEVFDLPEIPEIIEFIAEGESSFLSIQEHLTSGYQYVWFFNGELLPNETEAYLNCPDQGNYVIQIIDENNCQSSSAEYEALSCTTNTSNIDAIQKLELFPNPTNGLINLNLSFNETMLVESLSIYTSTGSLVSTQNLQLYTDIFQKKINVSDLPIGIYWLRINIDGQTETLRFVKD